MLNYAIENPVAFSGTSKFDNVVVTKKPIVFNEEYFEDSIEDSELNKLINRMKKIDYMRDDMDDVWRSFVTILDRL